MAIAKHANDDNGDDDDGDGGHDGHHQIHVGEKVHDRVGEFASGAAVFAAVAGNFASRRQSSCNERSIKT